jgi:hypothetical protein
MNNELKEMSNRLIRSHILVYPDGKEKKHEKLSKDKGFGTEIRVIEKQE